MSLARKWTAIGSQKINNSFTRTALGAAIGLALSAHAFAGFPTLYGKLQLTAGQYDFEKLNFAQKTPATPTTPATYYHVGATDVTTELDSFTVESAGSRLGVQ